jgi:hypothetical protein
MLRIFAITIVNDNCCMSRSAGDSSLIALWLRFKIFVKMSLLDRIQLWWLNHGRLPGFLSR